MIALCTYFYITDINEKNTDFLYFIVIVLSVQYIFTQCDRINDKNWELLMALLKIKLSG